MNNLLNVTNAADRAAVIQTNFERLDDVATNLKHVNLATVTVNSVDGEKSLLNGALTIPADALKAGDHIIIEASGNATDDDGPPNITFRIKVGATLITSDALPLADTGFWRLRSRIVVRSIGAIGEIQGDFKFEGDGLDPLNGVNANDTRDMSGDLLIDVTAEIDSNSNNFNCQQLAIKVER